MDLNGTVSIVTGGASGLGAQTARLLTERGARVLILDLNDEAGEALATEIGGAYVHADVTQEDDVQVAVDTAVEMGTLRSLVNCAGIGPPTKTVGRDFKPHDLRRFDKVIQINLVGTFNCTRLAAAAIAQTEPLAYGERGAVVNTASVAAFDGQIGQAAYAASKGGVVGMTLTLARDLSEYGIRVNTIAPGIIDTPLLGSLPDKVRDALAETVLFPKRLGVPEDYAGLCLHLLENGYMNGETVRMDGGIRMQPK